MGDAAGTCKHSDTRDIGVDLDFSGLPGIQWICTGVEVRGLEPLASSMRPRRSSQLSYTPAGGTSLPAAPRLGVPLTQATPDRIASERRLTAVAGRTTQ